MDGNRRIQSESKVPLLRTLPSSFFNQKQSQLLSERQLLELNASIVQYLKPLIQPTHPELFDVLREELNGKQEIDIPEQYLQKKWSTVLRLQRNIHNLETEIENLKIENDNLNEKLLKNVNSVINVLDKWNWVPSFIKSTLKLHKSPITAVSIHPFNPFLVTGSQDGTLAFWNLLNLAEPINIIPNSHSKSINDLKFKPDSSVLISCSSDQIIKVWDLSDPENVKIPIMTLTGHDHVVSSITVSAVDGNLLFSSSRDKTVKIWDLSTGWCKNTLSIHSDWIRSIDLLNNYLISCSSDTSIRLTHWPSGTGIGLCLGHSQVVEDVKFLPQASNQYLDDQFGDNDNNDKSYDQLGYKYAISCGRDKLVKLWKLPTCSFNSINGNPMPNPINPYAKCVKELKTHKSWVKKIILHYNSRYFFTCSDDQSIQIWDLSKISRNEEPIPLKVLNGHKSFVNTITIASPMHRTDELGSNPEKEILSDDEIRCYLVSGGADNLVNIWV